MDNGSTAPKERVNIVYKSKTDGAGKDIELPLKLMITGEFSTNPDDTSIEDRKVIDVNKNNFDSVMKEQKLELNLNVKSKLSDNQDEDEMIDVNLKINTLKDFEPDNLIQNIPELNKIYQLRQALKALKAPLGNLPSFRKKLEEIVGDEESKAKILEELKLNKEK